MWEDIKFWVILVTENSTKLHKLVLEWENELGHNLLTSSHLGQVSQTKACKPH
jgi:hypothetical protein